MPGRRSRSFIKRIGSAAGVLFVLAISRLGYGQPQFPIPADSPPRPLQIQGLSPQSDADAERWLRRAAKAAEGQDWKLAADTLSRVIEEFADKTVSPDEGKHYYSALTCAQRQIASWPEQGIEAYRLLSDPIVATQLALARKEHDVASLRTISRRYPMATQGPEAIELLATWLLDRHQSDEAIDLLNHLLELPHGKSPKWRILQTLAIAQCDSGNTLAAEQTLQSLIGQQGQGANVLPDDWAYRMESIRRFVEASKIARNSSASTRTVSNWPVQLGPTGARGRMMAVNPAVSPVEARRVGLPGADRLDVQRASKMILKRGRPPVWQAVSDGSALFFTCPDGLVARDLATFEFLWQAFPKTRSRDPRIDRQRAMTGIAVNNQERLDELSTKTFFHEYRGAVSTALGLVFMIEQGRSHAEEFPTKDGEASQNLLTLNAGMEPNSLRAFETDTGRAVWTKGRGGPIEDDLRVVHFFSAPAACGDKLVAPYQAGQDLYLAVLKRDGSVSRKVLLAGGPLGLTPVNGVLQPVVDAATIYLPTGGGLFIAINAYDFSLKWVASYERSNGTRIATGQNTRQAWWQGNRTPGGAQVDEWLSTPPLPAGDIVLLAPHDSGQLFAFDRRNGERLWSFPRGDHRCIVGANESLVVIAGKKVSALSLDDGRALWAWESAQPTGRPALCGDQVLVPTATGLARIEAATGKPIGQSLPTDRMMGNLLAVDGALYSIDATDVSKFPDLEQSRTIAKDQLARNANDVQALARLAWLESQEKNWKQAVALLDRAQKASSAAQASSGAAVDESLADRINHQRIVAMLNLAAELPAGERQRLLEVSRESATHAEDRLVTALALCDQLDESGEHSRAFLEGLDLLGAVGDEAIELEPGVTGRGAVAIRELLQRAWRKANDAQRAELEKGINERIDAAWANLDKADAQFSVAILTAWADALEFASQGAWLDLQLAKRCLSTGHVETAVNHLERCRRRSGGNETGAMSLALLAATYARPGKNLPGDITTARRVLAELESLNRNDELPTGFAEAAGLEHAANLKQWIAQIKALPEMAAAQAGSMPNILSTSAPLTLLRDDALPSQGFRSDCLAFWSSQSVEDPTVGMTPIRLMHHVLGVRTEKAAEHDVAWTMQLDSGVALEDPDDLLLNDYPQFNSQCGIVCGRAGVYMAEFQVFGVGLSTGLPLWPPIPVDRGRGALPNQPVVRANDQAIVAIDGITLIALPVREGAQPTWRRQFDGDGIGLLSSVGASRRKDSASSDSDHVIVVDRNRTKVSVLDAASGRMHRQFALAAGNEERGKSPRLMCAIVGGIICTSDEKAAIARDALTGRQLWTLPFEDSVQGLYSLDATRLGVIHGLTLYSVLDAATGTKILTVATGDLTLPPIDAVFDCPNESCDKGRLLLYSTTKSDDPIHTLASFPVSDDQQPWRRELGPLGMVNPRMMRASPRFIAAITYRVGKRDQAEPIKLAIRGIAPQGVVPPGAQIQVQPESKAKPVPEMAELIVLNKATGQPLIDRPYTFNEGRLATNELHHSRLINDVMVFDRTILAVAPEGYYLLTQSSARPVLEEERQ